MTRTTLAAAMLAAALGACASPGVPPGGPERHTPPMITRIDPDTNTVNVRGSEFIIHFDEVINERPAAAPTLGDLVLVSPRDGEPDVSWHRNAISIHPRKGWRPNTPYTVTLLPGVSDLRGNVRAIEHRSHVLDRPDDSGDATRRQRIRLGDGQARFAGIRRADARERYDLRVRRGDRLGRSSSDAVHECPRGQV